MRVCVDLGGGSIQLPARAKETEKEDKKKKKETIDKNSCLFISRVSLIFFSSRLSLPPFHSFFSFVSEKQNYD